MNTLYYGDNLDILQRYIKDESIDLIYLDPPFKSNRNYNVLFAERDGSRSTAQIKAFEDTWSWDKEASESFQNIVEKGPDKVSRVMLSFRKYLGDNDVLAYLSMMAPRLVELYRVLSPSGSIYLHCDPAASHYLKILMDAIFSPKNFQNEIIWHYSGWNRIGLKHFNRRHDCILYFSKSAKPQHYGYAIPWQSKEEYVRIRKQKVHIDENGEEYVLSDAGGGNRVKRYLEDAMSTGKPADDVWSIDKINNSSKELMGYQTQKPESLLERIIMASSKKSDIVLDPFCGCGTTVAVAQRLNRKWIGIDVTNLAIDLIKRRLKDTFGKIPFKVVGEPISVDDAKQLAQQDTHQFEIWALGLVDARPAEKKKGADKGIDGRLYFHDDAEKEKTKQIIFSVKSGHTGVSHIRDLRGVVERESAEIGVLISMRKPTKDMKAEAAGAGFYKSFGYAKQYHRLQILTIEDLLSGRKVDYPYSPHINRTFKKAPKKRDFHLEREPSQPRLPLKKPE